MSKEYILAHDLGTTGNKAVLVDFKGNLLTADYESYSVEYHGSEAVFQDPQVLWGAIAKTTRSVIEKEGIEAEQIACVAVTAQMFNMLPVNQKMNPIMPMISWLDRRTVEQAEWIINTGKQKKIFDHTKNAVSAKDIIPKILWFKENYPEKWKHTYKILDCKEYILYKLTGRVAVDWHGASTYFLFDPYQRTWSREACQAVGIPTRILPDIYSPTKMIGSITKQAAERTKLKEGTPVVLGLGDVGAAQIGSGAVADGEAHLCIGTATWVGLSSEQLINNLEQKFWALHHVVPNRWIVAGEMETGGGCLMWLRKILFPNGAVNAKGDELNLYQKMTEMVASVNPGSDGLLFLPWLSGERTLLDHFARGGFLGLSINHTRAHLVRAVMEGVAYHLRWIIDEIEKLGLPIEIINSLGGGSTSDIWTGIIANTTARKLRIVNNPQEVGAIGAALTAAIGLGLYPSLEDASADWVDYQRFVSPDTGSELKVYEDSYQEFKTIAEALKPIYRSRGDNLDNR